MRQVMCLSSLHSTTRISGIKALLTSIPIPIVANTAVVKPSFDQEVAHIAVVLGIHLDQVMLALAFAGFSLGKAISTDIVVAAIALLTVCVGSADYLVADVALQVDFPCWKVGEVGEIFRRATMFLGFAFIWGHVNILFQKHIILHVHLTNSFFDKISGCTTCSKTSSCGQEGR